MLWAFSCTMNHQDSHGNAPLFVPFPERLRSKPEAHGCMANNSRRLNPIGLDDLSPEGW